MLKNYLKIALRNLRKHRVISFINIFGLAIGIAVCLLILLFVHDELSYDRYNVHADRVYRIVKDFVNDDGSRLPDATTPLALGPAVQKEIPEVEYATRVYPGWGGKMLMRVGDKSFLEERFFRVDTSFFDVFTVPFVEGSAHDALQQPNSIVITQSIAKKYFGGKDAINEIIRTDAGDMKVTGVVKDVPAAAHAHFDFLMPLRKFIPNDDTWGWYNFYTYVLLKPGTNIATVVPKVQALYHKNDKDGKNIFYAQALTDIHLRSDLKLEIEPNSNILYIYIFTIIGLFVIAIACVNYINLSTAKSALRAREIGVRKVSGAFRASLIIQFIVESVVTVEFAFVLGGLLAAMLLPSINTLVEKQLSLSVLLGPEWLTTIVSAVLFIGLVAGIYPALYLSGIKPALVLKGQTLREGSIFSLRKALVIFQFTISIVLIAGTAVVLQQVNFIRNARLGFNKDQVMIIGDAGALSASNREAMINDLLKIKGVSKASTSNGVLGGLNWTMTVSLKGSKNSHLLNEISIGNDYLDVMGIKLKEGRAFSAAYADDTMSSGAPGTTERYAGSVILNETAVRDLNIPEPVVGRLLERGKDHDTTYYLKVVGVVKDFHFASFRLPIKPFGFLTRNDWQDNFTVKVASAGLDQTIAQVEKTWNTYAPGRPFRYSFLDQTFRQLYENDQRFNKVVAYLTILAIFIGCMGLFGLTAFMIERRTKEIGVRKVVGASAASIVVLLSRDFVKLVLLAVLIAIPIAWYAMNKWLDNFAYRVSIQWWVFAAAGAAAVLIALVTVSFQAVKAAMDNPVRALRSE